MIGRTRLIKYEACLDVDLAALSPEARLCFILLPTIADREGRLEDLPMKISAMLFPYDGIDLEPILEQLAAPRENSPGAFITRYKTKDGRKYLQINNFSKHQSPHKNEASSQIPSPTDDSVECRYISRNSEECTSYSNSDPNSNSNPTFGIKESTLASQRAAAESKPRQKSAVRWEPKPTWKKDHPSLKTAQLAIDPQHLAALKRDFPRVAGNGAGNGVEAEILAFKRYWLDNPNKAARKRDWRATLTRWLKRADERFDDARFKTEQRARAPTEPRSWGPLKEWIGEGKEKQPKEISDGDT